MASSAKLDPIPELSRGPRWAFEHINQYRYLTTLILVLLVLLSNYRSGFILWPRQTQLIMGSAEDFRAVAYYVNWCVCGTDL